MIPKIYLSIDNCFASKRWTLPEEWLPLIRDMGLRYAEASADTECDPLYSTAGYLESWKREVADISRQTGVKVSQFFSGHGTYSTCGLTHTDPGVRRHILENWLYPMGRLAGSMQANLGFYCHAFPRSVLYDGEQYEAALYSLKESLALAAKSAYENGCKTVSLEQMYTPHQVPWTIRGTQEMLRDVTALSGHPFYTVIDLGHQVGQRRFLRKPGDPALHPHLTACEADTKTAHWLKALGCYSPILHVQQTDGIVSSHLPFTEAYNRIGLVRGDEVLSALLASFRQPEQPGMPPRVREIFITLEIFASTAETDREILHKLAESVEYWRQYIPEDGLPLDALVERTVP